MKIALAASALALGLSVPQGTPEPPPLSVKDLRERKVIGHLGAPLGAMVTVDAVIVDGAELRDKQNMGRFLLRIVAVGDAPIEPVTLPFSVHAMGKARLATGIFELFELKHGTKAGGLDEKQVEELKAGYVGTTVKLQGYETGLFRGIPSPLPPEVPVWADHSFCFVSSFEVLRRVD